MKKVVIASIVCALYAGAALAQAQQGTPADKPAAKKSTKPVKVKNSPPPTRRQAIEEATPLSEPDPSIKLNENQLAIAKTVFTGVIQRMLSSTSPGINDGSAFTLANSSGCSARPQIAPAVEEEVVSCPAVATMM